MTPEMLLILRQAVADPAGQVSVTRPTHGGWPESVRLYRQLEKNLHLTRLFTGQNGIDGIVTAVYRITDEGRRALAREQGESHTPSRRL